MTKIIPPKIAFLNKMEGNIPRKTTILSGQFPQFDADSPRQQIKREMRELEAEKQQKALPIPAVNFYAEKGNPKEEEEKKENARRRKRELIRRTLSEDYPGLDYLGIHNVLNARFRWYRVLWFSIVSICLLIGLFTIYRIIREYFENPTATSISVKSVEKLLLPQLTICATNAATVNLEKLERELFGNNPRIGNYEPEDVPNFAFFMLAGSGFQKMNWKKLDGVQKERMNHFYDIFQQEQSVEQFFNEFFNNFGLDCRQFFEDCQLGDKKLDCCQVFEPIYLIRRGRCFRTVPFYQQNFDELGKLRVQLRHPHQMDSEMSTEREIIAFIAEHKPQIAPFPRYYLYPGIWTKIRLTAKRIRLLPGEEVCSDEFKETGKDFCYIEKWLRTYLEGPLNCTYPYMHRIRPTQLPSCQPITLFENYANAVETVNYTMQSCTLPCDRWEYTVSMEKINTEMVYKDANLSFVYRVDLSFSDLQFELIEEVGTVTFAGLISQIGGQMSLFMGSSILTLIQAVIMAVIIGHRILRANQRRQNAVGGEEGENWGMERHEMKMEGRIGQRKDGPKKYAIGSRERAERGGGIGL